MRQLNVAAAGALVMLACAAPAEASPADGGQAHGNTCTRADGYKYVGLRVRGNFRHECVEIAGHEEGWYRQFANRDWTGTSVFDLNRQYKYFYQIKGSNVWADGSYLEWDSPVQPPVPPPPPPKPLPLPKIEADAQAPETADAQGNTSIVFTVVNGGDGPADILSYTVRYNPAHITFPAIPAGCEHFPADEQELDEIICNTSSADEHLVPGGAFSYIVPAHAQDCAAAGFESDIAYRQYPAEGQKEEKAVFFPPAGINCAK